MNTNLSNGYCGRLNRFLVKPIRLVLLWAAFLGFWTALMRPIVGMPVWDFVEHWTNWGAPLALLLLIGWPKNWLGRVQIPSLKIGIFFRIFS